MYTNILKLKNLVDSFILREHRFVIKNMLIASAVNIIADAVALVFPFDYKSKPHIKVSKLTFIQKTLKYFTELCSDRSPIEDRQLSNDSVSSAESAGTVHLTEHSTYARRKLDQLQERHNNKTQVINKTQC